MENCNTKKGRPKKERCKDAHLTVRLDRDDMGLLLKITNETGETYSEVMRKCIRFYDLMRKI